MGVRVGVSVNKAAAVRGDRYIQKIRRCLIKKVKRLRDLQDQLAA